jgi:hypothetical protein
MACPRRDDDRGATLLELAVGAAVTVVVGGVFVTGMLQMRTSATANEGLAVAQEQAHRAFQRLEKDVRYATGISVPAHVNGSWYVEYATSDAGVDHCTQLRMTDGSGEVQSRRQRAGPPVSGWQWLAGGLTGARAFTRTAAGSAGLRHQQLTVAFRVSGSGPAGQQARPQEFTFTALNTSAETSATVCAGMGRS